MIPGSHAAICLYGLQKISVRPYYLFHCDPVKGCGHFRTEINQALTMMEEIWQAMFRALPAAIRFGRAGKVGKSPL